MMAVITIMSGNDQGGAYMAQPIRAIGILGVIALVALFALLPMAWAAPRAATKNVTIKDNLFDPKTITVNVGDTVMWMDQGQNEHTVTADDASFDSGDLKTGEKTSFAFTFSKAGTFAYHCKYHASLGMVGTVVVQAAAAPTSAAAPAAAAPSKLPRTGGEEISGGVVLAALALLAIGALLTLRRGRRSV
jgi:LPXTG-motif cell wall-anchored protein